MTSREEREHFKGVHDEQDTGWKYTRLADQRRAKAAYGLTPATPMKDVSGIPVWERAKLYARLELDMAKGRPKARRLARGLHETLLTVEKCTRCGQADWTVFAWGLGEVLCPECYESLRQAGKNQAFLKWYEVNGAAYYAQYRAQNRDKLARYMREYRQRLKVPVPSSPPVA
jgi:hypothetical protein